MTIPPDNWKLRHVKVRKGHYNVYFDNDVHVRAVYHRLTDKWTFFSHGYIQVKLIKDHEKTMVERWSPPYLPKVAPEHMHRKLDNVSSFELENRTLMDTCFPVSLTVFDIATLPDPSETIQTPFIRERFDFL